MIIDSHSHLNDPAFEPDRESILKQTLDQDVWVINVGDDLATSGLAVRMAKENPEGVFAAAALHPLRIEEGFDPEAYGFFLGERKTVAVGETGLDYYRLPGDSRDAAIKEAQKEIFGMHLELAFQTDKPVIIHCRQANDEILAILTDWQEKTGGKLRGVAHSFVGNYRQARRYRELGFKISVNGIITYARDYDKVIRDTPIADILAETDAPYLAPEPIRGQRNVPANVKYVIKKLAEIKEIPAGEAERITTENARELFKI